LWSRIIATLVAVATTPVAVATTLVAVAVLLVPTRAEAGTALFIDPSSPEAAASRIRAIDLTRLAADLGRVGLELPPRLEVALVPEHDERARRMPSWIVGLAPEPERVVIFHERVLPYPYDSIESVFRHEVAHLALAARAGGRPLPRWLHEGVAMSVDHGWGPAGRLRLLIEMTGKPATADLTRLFASGAQPDTARAYGLSAALIADVQRRHGADSPARIAGRVASGIPFQQAFELVTSETPDDAAERAWRGYRRWTIWVSALTGQTMIWGVIMTLAVVAAVAQARRRARRRRQWDEADALDL
jgi:hypothetical protein